MHFFGDLCVQYQGAPWLKYSDPTPLKLSIVGNNALAFFVTWLLLGCIWLYLTTVSLLTIFIKLRLQICCTLFSWHCVLTWIMIVLTMGKMESVWQVNNNLTDLTWGSHNLYLVQNTPSFMDKTQGLCSFQCSSQSSVWSSFPLATTQTTSERGRGLAENDLSSLGHHCLCMPLSLVPSVKAPLRADRYLSLWSPYLLTVSLLLMILKPLFILKRVWPVPVKREQ